jgi:ubiquinone/menaquinone biosynthesis C-methylase UbiE
MEAAAKAAGVKSPKPLSVYQKLNHERILRIEHAPGEPEFRGNTLTQAAGFEPNKNEPRVGKEFTKFFEDVSAGRFGKSNKSFVPEQDLSDVAHVDAERQKHVSNFENHIDKSIPMHYEEKTRKIDGIVKSYPDGARVLDIAGSEGDLGKTVSALSGGKITSVTLDPNEEMARQFADKSQVPGATYAKEAFLHPFDDYKAHNPAEKYDVVNESMGFQFIDPNRAEQIPEVKRMMTPDGVFLTNEKLKNPDWTANEAVKDSQFKSKYFGADELAEKEKKVGFQQSKAEQKSVGMLDNMATQSDYESTLKKNFKHVTQYFDSGNFKGYAASDDPVKLKTLVDNIGDLNSKFSTTATPKEVRFEPSAKDSTESEKDFNLESGFARNLLSGKKSIEDFPYYNDYKKTIESEILLLPLHTKKILFIGSGPVPLSAHLMGERTGAEIHVLERSPEAAKTGSAVLDLLGTKAKTEIGDAKDFKGYANYDAVVLALEAGDTSDTKSGVIKSIAAQIRPDAVLLARGAKVNTGDSGFPTLPKDISGLKANGSVDTFGGLSQTTRLVKSGARFEPATQAGKEAEKKGLVFKLQDYGGGTMELSLETPEGQSVSSLSASQTGPKYAQVDSVITSDGYKKQGLAEALYRELGAHLQAKGVKVLGGLTVGDSPRNIRKRVFGPPVQETKLNSAPGMDFRRTHSAVRPETKFEPASAAGAEGKDSAKAEKAWQEKGFKSPYFKKWFGKSKVVDSEGEPKIVYHGTTHEFDQFTMDRANPENAFGRGFYFTDEAYDASDNYAGVGPDLRNQVEQRAERIESENDGLGAERAKRQAMDELVGGADRTIEAYLKMENPVVVDKKGGTQYEFHFDEDSGTESGNGVDLYESILRNAPKFGVDGQELWNKISENGTEISAYDVHKALRTGDFYPEDPETGAFANGELVKDIFRDLGHDGIILHNAEEEYPGMNLPGDTTHYVAFDPTQVKAAKNRGTFSKVDPRYNFEPVKFNTSEIAQDIWNKAKEGGGFTYNPYSHKFLKTGYSASIYPDKDIQQIIDPKDLTQATLEKFIDDRKHLLTRAENSVGGWVDPETGKLYLDVAFTTPSRPLAEYAGREYNQKAIGDLAKYAAGENGDISTGGTSEPLEDMPPSHQRVDELLKDYAWEQPDLFGDRPKQELMPGIGTRAPLSSKEIGDMTKAELLRHYPEALVPKRRKDLIDYDIKNAPRWKGKENATDIAADELEKFSRARLPSQEFQDGLKWYSEFVPLLKRSYGKFHEMMAQLLAATSPRNSPQPNFASANDAIEGYKTGRFDKQIKKYLDGAKMLESGNWKSWYEKRRKAGKLIKPRDNPSNAAFMAEWIEAHDLAPRQSNGKLYGMHSVPVLQVMAGKWLTENTGPKTLQFVKNLLGVHHGATIDVWAARTMRRLGHEGISDRWRVIPGNETGVNETDFHFSQEAFEKAASRLGVKPDALQGALWFAEKKLWAERGWGRLDFGDFRKEIAKREMLNQGIQKRLAESKSSATSQ